MVTGVIIGVFNAKGGIGKTTTSLALAVGLASLGHQVLLVDGDFQANASLALGIPRAELKTSLLDVKLKGLAIRAVTRPTSIPNLALVSSAPQLLLMGAFAASESLETALFLPQALEGERKTYDYIVLDIPGSLEQMAINALAACDYIIVPVQPLYMSVEAVPTLLSAISVLRQKLKGGIGVILGLLFTLVDRRLASTVQTIDALRQRFGSLVFNTEINFSPKQAEAARFGLDIYHYSPRSSASRSYRKFVLEVISRIKA